MDQLTLEKKLIYYLKGNQWALRMCLQLLYVSHLWDDLIDKDKERTENEINDAFRICLYDIPSNPFYVQNVTILLPLIHSAIIQYEAANKIEKADIQNKESAFWLRNGVLNVIGTSIYLIGGIDWYREVSGDFYSFLWQDYQSLYDIFKQEMKNG